jgi:hypothetical protein
MIVNVLAFDARYLKAVVPYSLAVMALVSYKPETSTSLAFNLLIDKSYLHAIGIENSLFLTDTLSIVSVFLS